MRRELLKDPLFKNELNIIWNNLSTYIKSKKSKIDFYSMNMNINNYVKNCVDNSARLNLYFENIEGRFYNLKRFQVAESFMKKVNSLEQTK